MRMREYIIRRLILLIPVLLGVTVITFTITNVAMDPLSLYITERTRPDMYPLIRAKYGLDRPLYERYFLYLFNLVKGDWGVSRSAAGLPVTQVIGLFLPATAELAVTSMILIIALGIPTGIISATRRNKPVDHVSRIVALSGISIPIFWLALMMQLIFFYYFKTQGWPYLPAVRRYDSLLEFTHPLNRITNFFLLDSLLTGNWVMFVDALTHLIMPAVALCFHGFGVITRIVRSSMLEVMRQDYITLARAKGLKERTVIYKHALRNAMIPTLTLSGLLLAGLLTGAVLTETIFSWPGIGRWAAEAIIRNDISAIMGFTVFVTFVFVLGNLIVDLLYAFVDPRIRIG